MINVTKKEQLENFNAALISYGKMAFPRVENWIEAFRQLIHLLEHSYKRGKVGGVAGVVDFEGFITNCYVMGTVNGNGNYYGDSYSYNAVGGMVGVVDNGTVINCYVSGAVNGRIDAHQLTGGMVGWLYGGIVANCYATNTVSGGYRCSGIVGNGAQGRVFNCAALNSSIGSQESMYNNITRVSYLDDISFFNNVAWSGMQAINGTFASRGHGADITSTQAKTASFWVTPTSAWTGWDTNVWDIANGRLPILKNVGGNQLANNPPAHLQ